LRDEYPAYPQEGASCNKFVMNLRQVSQKFDLRQHVELVAAEAGSNHSITVIWVPNFEKAS